MPLESKNPVTHDRDRQLMNVQTSENLDARGPTGHVEPGTSREERGRKETRWPDRRAPSFAN